MLPWERTSTIGQFSVFLIISGIIFKKYYMVEHRDAKDDIL